MKISLLHPSRNRAAMADATIAEWLGKRSGLHPIEYIISIDTSDGQIADYRRLAERHGARLLIRPNRNSVQACNQAALVATGDLLIMVSDDFGCPPGWDDALARSIGDRRDVAVFVDDGLGARTMTLPIVDRAFYQRSGFLLFPGYAHMFCDNDLEESSRRLGKLIEARQLLFPHRHYILGAAPYDPTYHHAGHTWGRDALVFEKRRARDFDLRPRTLRDVVTCSRLHLHYVFVVRPRYILESVARRWRAKRSQLTWIPDMLLKSFRRCEERLSRLRWRFDNVRFGGKRWFKRSLLRPLARMHGGEVNQGARRLAVIVPFRESQHPAALSQGEGREAQLTRFIDHMTKFLTGTDYHIFVIEQSQDGLPFNKGCLMNVGFNIASAGFDYFAFHDVDQIPTNPLNTYSYPSAPLHLCVVTDGRTQYRSTVGGALLINRDDFASCNGWSNHYLGWGQEDDDMAARLRNSVGFRRVAEDVGTYTSIGHARIHGLDETYQFYKNRCYLQKCANAVNPKDGYRDATFEVLSQARLSGQCTRCVVSIPGPSRLFGYHCYVQAAELRGEIAIYRHLEVRSQIACLHDCAIDRTRVRLRAGGGEMPAEPLPEEQEYAVFEKGTLQLPNPGTLDPARIEGYQQRLLLSAGPVQNHPKSGEEPVTTFVIERREYVNLYHTLIEIFNAYVAIQLLARTGPFNLLFLDGHCRGSLDPLWSDILKPTQIHRLHDYPCDTMRFKKLVLVPGGYDSPLYNTGRIEPSRFENFLSDFIATVLAAYGIGDNRGHEPVLTFIDRRDYKPHPRSDGIVCRKVDNLDATVDLLRRLYPQHRVDVHSFENMPFGEQLRIVRESDVLCGVHGAALAHALFMRPGSELVEFRPREYRRNDIFENLATLRGVRYRCHFAETRRILPGGKLVVQPTN